MAQAIHRRSPRAGKPFLVVTNSIPTELLEDNLFGHTRGAFTGATSSKPGLLEMADGGTILFDEISTVALEVQAKLLRVMQEREFLPLGALESKTVDVRILAATNEDLKTLTEQGRFREDLFYRLNVISSCHRCTSAPSPCWWSTSWPASTPRTGRTWSEVTPEVLERLLTHSWSGNVRELENVIERGVVLARSRDRPGPPPRELLERVSLPVAVLPEGMGPTTP